MSSTQDLINLLSTGADLPFEIAELPDDIPPDVLARNSTANRLLEKSFWDVGQPRQRAGQKGTTRHRRWQCVRCGRGWGNKRRSDALYCSIGCARYAWRAKHRVYWNEAQKAYRSGGPNVKPPTWMGSRMSDSRTLNVCSDACSGDQPRNPQSRNGCESSVPAWRDTGRAAAGGWRVRCTDAE